MIIFDYTDRAQSPEAQEEGDFRVIIPKINTQEAGGEQTTVKLPFKEKYSNLSLSILVL